MQELERLQVVRRGVDLTLVKFRPRVTIWSRSGKDYGHAQKWDYITDMESVPSPSTSGPLDLNLGKNVQKLMDREKLFFDPI